MCPVIGLLNKLKETFEGTYIGSSVYLSTEAWEQFSYNPLSVSSVLIPLFLIIQDSEEIRDCDFSYNRRMVFRLCSDWCRETTDQWEHRSVRTQRIETPLLNLRRLFETEPVKSQVTKWAWFDTKQIFTRILK